MAYHSFDFYEKRKNDPRWHDEYLQAKQVHDAGIQQRNAQIISDSRQRRAIAAQREINAEQQEIQAKQMQKQPRKAQKRAYRRSRWSRGLDRLLVLIGFIVVFYIGWKVYYFFTGIDLIDQLMVIIVQFFANL